MSYKTPLKRVLFSPCLTPVRVGVFSVVFILAATLVGDFVFAPQKAEAASSSTLNFQARLEGSAGNIVADGNYNVEFKLYNTATVTGTPDQGACTYNGGTGDTNCLWVETRVSGNQVRVANGYLTVNLGSVNAFPTTINWDQDLWITMRVGGTSGTPSWDAEMTPRLRLTAVPYAFRAGQLAVANNSTGYTSVLQLIQPGSGVTGNEVFQVPDMGAAGTYTICVQGGSGCGGGGGSYVTLQGGTPGAPDTGNLNISGTGIFGTALQGPSLDTASVRTLAIGGTNANAITMGNVTNTATTSIIANTTLNLGNNANNKTVNIGATGSTANTTTVNIATTTGAAQTVNIGSTNGTSTTTIQAGSGMVNLAASSSSLTTPVGRIIQNGSADATLQFAANSLTSNYVLGLDASTGNFVLNSSNAASGYLSPGYVQSAAGASGSTSATTITKAFSGNTVSGHLIAVGVAWDATANATFTCSDNMGNSYTSLPAVLDSSSEYAGVCYAPNITGGATTVTVTFSTSTPYRSVAISEYSGLAATAVVDAYASNTASGTTATDNATSGSMTTTQNDLIFGFLGTTGAGGAVTITAGTGYTQRVYNGTAPSVAIQDRQVSTPGTVTSTQTVGTATTYVAYAVAFKVASGSNSDNFAHAVMSINQAGGMTLRNSTDSATAFRIQNTAGTNLLTADTAGSQILFGQASALSGKLVVASSGGGSITLTVGSTAVNYTLNLPGAAPSAGGQCLQTASGSTTNLSWGTCGGGGGSHVKAVTMVPEYAGAIFNPSGTNNNGYMSSGYAHGAIPGSHHNYYDWTTDQATAQNYDIVLQYQIPSDYSSFVAGSWKIWTYVDSLTSTDITWDIRSASDGDCYSTTQHAKPGSATTWTQISLSDPGNGCTFAAGDTITIDINATAISPSTNQVRVGEFTYQYNTAY